MVEKDFIGKTVVVTEGAGIIGKAIGTAFAGAGARVAVCDRNLDAARDAARALRASSADAEGFQVDLGRRGDLAANYATIIARFGQIDVLINNDNTELAEDERAPLHEFDMERYDQIVNAGIKGLFSFSQLCAQDMVKRKGGCIVNITSIRGLIPVANQTPVVAVSAAVVGMTRMWGLELKNENIRVNAIAAGITSCNDPRKLAHLAIQRPATPADIASAALFLASPGASYITGVVLPVDGGLSAGYVRSF